jgi:hypothetical protein
MVTPADWQDRDIARELLWRLRLVFPAVTIVWADSAYSGELVAWAKMFLNLTIKVISRPPGKSGFVVLPRRWVVERTLLLADPGQGATAGTTNGWSSIPKPT